MPEGPPAYDIAVSFADAQRASVEAVVQACRQLGVTVFYDEDSTVEFWGRNKIRGMRETFGGTRARYFVPFLSSDYLCSAYPMDQYDAALPHAIRTSGDSYILPIFVGAVQVPADMLSPAVGYLHVDEYSPDQIAQIIAQRVGVARAGNQEPRELSGLAERMLSLPSPPASHSGPTIADAARPPTSAEWGSATDAFRLEPFPGEPQSAVGGSPSALLRATDRLVEFFGRDAELARLATWRDSADTIAALLVHGPGGQGKTRLSIEFAERAAARGWRTQHAVPETVPDPDPGRTLQGTALLVVVDYAERWPRSQLTALIQHVLARRPDRVRLLLVARQAGYWWKGLANPLLKLGVEVSELRLGALADTVAQRRLAFTGARDRFAELLGVTEITRLRPAGSLEDEAYGLALTLHMAALVAVDAHSSDANAPSDPRALSTYLAGRELDHWHSMVDSGLIGTRPAVMSRLVALGTMTQGLPPPDAEALIVELGLAGTGTEAQTLIDDHSQCYPSQGARVLSPLLPDRLGEDFLADSLPDIESGGGDPWSGRLPARLIIGAGPHVAPVLSVLIETSARWEHVRRDYLIPLLTKQPDLILRAEGGALVTLAGYAELNLLEALNSAMPERDVELDGGIAALSRKLTDFALARTDDEATKAGLYQKLSVRLGNAGMHDDAVVASREAVKIRRHLADRTPGSDESVLAEALGDAGIDLWHAGLLAESVAAFTEAVDIYRRCATGAPDTYTSDLATQLTNLAGALLSMDRLADALGPAQEASDLFARLGKERPSVELDLQLASARRNLAIILGRLGRRAESLVNIQGVVQIFRRLDGQQPRMHTPGLAESLHTLSNQLAAADRNTEALAAVAESVAIMRRLVATNRSAHENALVVVLISLAKRLWDAGDQAAAVTIDEEAVDISRCWPAPSATQGVALNSLARHLALRDEQDTALAAVDEAITIWRTLILLNPNSFDERLAHATALRAKILGRSQREKPPG